MSAPSAPLDHFSIEFFLVSLFLISTTIDLQPEAQRYLENRRDSGTLSLIATRLMEMSGYVLISTLK